MSSGEEVRNLSVNFKTTAPNMRRLANENNNNINVTDSNDNNNNTKDNNNEINNNNINFDDEIKTLIDKYIYNTTNHTLNDNSADKFRSDIENLIKQQNNNHSHKHSIIRRLVRALSHNEIAGIYSNSAISAILSVLSTIPQRFLVSLLEICTDDLELSGNNGKAFELLAPLMSYILKNQQRVDCSLIKYDDMSPSEYLDGFILNLLARKWSKSVILSVLQALRELSLSDTHLIDLINKINRLMNNVDMEQLPALIYQLLLLASKSTMLYAIRCVLNHIAKLEENLKHEENELEILNSLPYPSSNKTYNELIQIEGTILLHINFAIKHDQNLGQTIISLVKTRQCQLSNFTFGVLLTIARIPRFENSCFKLLTNYMVETHKSLQLKENSKWLRHFLKKANCLYNINTYKLCIGMCDNLNQGWDYIIPSLLKLGRKLMEINNKTLIGITNDNGESIMNFSLADKPIYQYELSADTNTIRLGALVLKELFKNNESIRDELFEQLMMCILMNGNNNNALIYITLLENLICERPQSFTHVITKLRDTLDYMSNLSLLNACALLKACAPLFVLHHDLKNHTILLLKKYVFSRNIETRSLAISGFFTMVDCASIHALNTGVSTSQLTNVDNSSCELFLEGVGFIRRALTQQVNVRKLVYKRMKECFLLHDSTRSYITDIFLGQLLKYYQKNSIDSRIIIGKLDLTSIIDNDGKILDSISMLCCMSHRILLTSYHDESTKVLRKLLHHIMLEFKSMNKESISNLQVEQYKTHRHVVCELYDLCIEYWLYKLISIHNQQQQQHNNNNNNNNNNNMNEDNMNENVNEFFQIFEHCLIMKTFIIKELPVVTTTKAKRSKKKRRIQKNDHINVYKTSEMNNIFDINFILKCWELINRDINQVSMTIKTFLMEKTLIVMNELNITHLTENIYGYNILQQSSEVVKYMFMMLRTDHLIHESLQILKICIKILKRYGNHMFVTIFISSFDDSNDNITEEDKFKMYYEEFQRLIKLLYDAQDYLALQLCFDIMSSTILSIAKELFDNKQKNQNQNNNNNNDNNEIINDEKTNDKYIYKVLEDHIKFMRDKCCMELIPNDSVTYKIMHSYLLKILPQKQEFKALNQVGEDIQIINDDTLDNSIRPSYTIPSQTSKGVTNKIPSLIFERVHENLLLVDWSIQQLKNAGTSAQLFETDESMSDKKKQFINKKFRAGLGTIYMRLSTIYRVLRPPTETCFLDENANELLSTLCHYYKVVTNVFKLAVWLKEGFHTKRIPLIKDISKRLTPIIYQFLKVLGDNEDKKTTKAGEERRLIPNLIFQIEQYQQIIIKLDNTAKAKGAIAGLLQRSTNRDFRIQVDRLPQHDDNENQEDDNENQDDEETESDDEDDERAGLM